MINASEKSRLGQIQQLIWQQSWPEAENQCQALLDDDTLSGPAQTEAKRLAQEIQDKQLAELEIKQTLKSVEEALQTPLPNYEELQRKLQHAQALGEKQHILRWHSELRARADALRRRKDIHLQLEEDRQRFKEALKREDYDQALEIANRLSEEAEVNQQPALAESARAWLSRLNEQLHLEQIANSIRQALEREDYEWASRLFDQLPAHSQRTLELAPLVDDARASLRLMREDLESAQKSWAVDKMHNFRVAEGLLRDLKRQHPNSNVWRAFWLEFYSDRAMQAGRYGDSQIAEGEFEQAVKSYTEALKALHALRDVFLLDADFREREQVMRTYVEVSRYLGEAQGIMEQRGQIAVAQAACNKALEELIAVPESVKGELVALHRRTLDFQQQLREQEQVIALLERAEALPSDADIENVQELLDTLSQLLIPLPKVVQKRIDALTAQTEQRRASYMAKMHQARAASPDAAFTLYQQAWKLAQSDSLREEIVKLCLAQAAQASTDKLKSHWLMRGAELAPGHKEIQIGLLALSLRPDFDKDYLPLRSQLAALKTASDPKIADVEQIRIKATHLLEQFGKVPELRASLENAIKECQYIIEELRATDEILAQVRQHCQRGSWPTAIKFLHEQQAKITLTGATRKLREETTACEEKWQQASQTYTQANAAYQAALAAYQETIETHDYDKPLALLAQAEDKLGGAFDFLKPAAPREWQKSKQDIRALKTRAQKLQETWTARLEPGALPGKVRDLREALQNQPTDPIANGLLDELSSQAVQALKEQAQAAERNGMDDKAREALEQALELGGEDPALRHRLETVRTRDQRREAIKALRLDIDKYSKRSGGLRDAVRAQTELLRLLADDTGEERWVKDIADLMAISQAAEQSFVALVGKVRDEGREEDNEQLEARKNSYRASLRETDQQLEALRQAALGAGVKISELLKEAEKWLRLKQQLVSYNAATSAKALNDLIIHVKELLKLNLEAITAGTYDYRDELAQSREEMLQRLRDSATKRLNEARLAIEQETFEKALESLKSVEPDFYAPILVAFPEQSDRLTQKGSSEADLLLEVQREIQQTERLLQISESLRAWQEKIRTTSQTSPEAALEMIDDARLEDPREECPKHLDKLTALEAQIKRKQAELSEKMAKSAIGVLEDDVDNASVDTDYYKELQNRLREIQRDILNHTYQHKYDVLEKRITERIGLPARIQRGDEAFGKGNYALAFELYAKALAIDPDLLGSDTDFMQNYEEAKKQVEDQRQAKELIAAAQQQLHDAPLEAIKTLERARVVAENQGAEDQVQRIQRLIYRTQARLTLDEAQLALDSGKVQSALDKATLARSFAEKSKAEEQVMAVAAFLHSIEERSQDQKKTEEQIARAQVLMSQCKWQAALEEIIKLGSVAADLREQIHSKLTEVEKTRAAIKTSIEAGKFTDAETQLARARTDLLLSEADVEALRVELDAAQNKMREWQDKFDQLVHGLASGTPLNASDLTPLIEESRKLSIDNSAVPGRQSLAGLLSRALQDLKLKLENVEKSLRQVDTLTDLEALEKLAGMPGVYTLPIDSEPIQINHGHALEINALRRRIINRYFTGLKEQSESPIDFPLEALKTILAESERFKVYLTQADDLATFTGLYEAIEQALQEKETLRACGDWRTRIETVREQRSAGETPSQLLALLNKIDDEIKQRSEETPRETWGDMRLIRHEVLVLQQEINRELSLHVHDSKKQAFESARNAEQHGDLIQLETALSTLTELHKDNRLSETDRAEVQAEVVKIQKAIENYKSSLETLESVKQHLGRLNYKEAGRILNTPLLAPALRETWGALGKVVSILETSETLMAQAKEWNTPQELRVGMREAEEVLERCEALLNAWSENLGATDNLGRTLRWEIERLIPQTQTLLAGIVYQQALLALREDTPDEAENLRKIAIDKAWATGEYTQRFQELEQEIALVRAMIALESALLTTEWDDAAQHKLDQLCKAFYTRELERRKRASWLLELAEIRSLLQASKVDEAELRIGNPDLLNVRRPYTLVSREVTKYASEMKKNKELCKFLDSISFSELEANWQTKVEEAQRLRQGNPPLEQGLNRLTQRLTDEVKLLRLQGDYGRLQMLNPLALQLGLAEPDIVSLRQERDSRFQSEVAQARDKLLKSQPEQALKHIMIARSIGTDAQFGEIRDLQQEIEHQRLLCQDSDILITKAQADLVQGDYDAAAQKYRTASEATPSRTSVCDFAETLHNDWWAAFEKTRAEEAFLRAEEIADRSLKFGFKKIKWQEARKSLIQERDQRLKTLLESIAGPGHTVKDGRLISTGGVLADPDPDLDAVSHQLRMAQHWQSDQSLLEATMREVETRKQRLTEAKLDLRQGWLAIERGSVESALDYFNLASECLERPHPEVEKWMRFSELVLRINTLLTHIEQRSEKEGEVYIYESGEGTGKFIVACPEWKDITTAFGQIKSIFAQPAHTHFLGEEGQAQQYKMQQWLQLWGGQIELVTNGLAEMQRCCDTRSFDSVTRPHTQALQALKTLRQIVHADPHSLSRELTSPPQVELAAPSAAEIAPPPPAEDIQMISGHDSIEAKDRPLLIEELDPSMAEEPSESLEAEPINPALPEVAASSEFMIDSPTLPLQVAVISESPDLLPEIDSEENLENELGIPESLPGIESENSSVFSSSTDLEDSALVSDKSPIESLMVPIDAFEEPGLLPEEPTDVPEESVMEETMTVKIQEPIPPTEEEENFFF